MLITSEHLDGACKDQVDLFNKTFPIGAEFNKPNWDLALGVGLQVSWMEKILDASARKRFHKAEALARNIYDKATAPAWKLYTATTAPAWKLYYEETETSAWKIYDETIVPAAMAYHEAMTPALKIYQEAKALILFNVLEKQFSAKKKFLSNLITYLKSLMQLWS